MPGGSRPRSVHKLEFGTPPKRVKPGGWRLEILAQLQERPGEWAIVETGLSFPSTASWMRLGCQATGRTRDDGKFDIWARWCEPDAEELEE